MATVHIFGNSLAYGLYGLEDDWSSRLKQEAAERRLKGEQPFVTVANHAGPGNMLVHSLDSEQITANVRCHRRGRQLGVFAVGSCESCILYPHGDTKPRRSLSDFRDDLSRLTGVVEDLNQDGEDAAFTPIFMSAAPVDEEKADLIWGSDVFNNKRLEEYDETVREHAEATGAAYVDLRSGFDGNTMLAVDAIHPNQYGSRLIYERMSTVVFGTLGLSVAPTEALKTD